MEGRELDWEELGKVFGELSNLTGHLAKLCSARDATAAAPTLSPKLSEVISEYIAEKEFARRWTPKTRTENLAGFELFQRIVGNKDFWSIRYDCLKKYRETLVRLPPNLQKRRGFRGKSIEQILRRKNLRPRAPQTVSKDLIRIRALFRWALARGYTDRNYAEGLTVSTRKKHSEKRKPFTKKDLEALILNDEFLLKTGKRRKHSYCFWLPLLGMYTGARLNELCQLSLDDFKEIDGIQCIHFREGDGARLKTVAAERIIPVHPTLIELGLINRVDYLRKRKYKRLFPELPLQRDGYAQTASKWFARYKRRCGITDPRKVFHSFRHTVTMRLKENGVPVTEAAAFVGHADKSMTYGWYGKEFSPKGLLRAVEMIDYEIDLSLIPRGN